MYILKFILMFENCTARPLSTQTCSPLFFLADADTKHYPKHMSFSYHNVLLSLRLPDDEEKDQAAEAKKFAAIEQKRVAEQMKKDEEEAKALAAIAIQQEQDRIEVRKEYIYILINHPFKFDLNTSKYTEHLLLFLLCHSSWGPAPVRVVTFVICSLILFFFLPTTLQKGRGKETYCGRDCERA